MTLLIALLLMYGFWPDHSFWWDVLVFIFWYFRLQVVAAWK